MEEKMLVPYGGREADIQPIDDSYAIQADEGGHGSMGILSILLRKWYVALTGAVIASAIGIPLIWFLTKPMYTATSAIEVAPVIPRIVFEDDSAAVPTGFYSNYVSTQAALIMSNRILYSVLEDPAVRRLDYLKQFDDPLVELNENFVAVVDRKSQLLLVSMTGEDPRAIADIVNAAVRSYMRVEGGQEATSEDEKLRTLERERDAAYERLRSLHESARQLGEEYGTTDLAAREELMLTRVQSLLEELTKVETAQIALQAQAKALDDLDEAPPSPADLVRMQNEYVAADPLVTQLSSTIAQLEQEYALAPLRLTEDAAAYKMQRRALENLKARLEEARTDAAGRFEEMMSKEMSRERQIRKEDLQGQLAQLKAHEERITSLLSEQNDSVIALGRKALDIKKIQDELQLVNDLYQALVHRIQVLQVERQRPARIRVAYTADVPRYPSRDKRKKYSIVIAMGSVLFGCALVVFLHELDMRVESPSEVAAKTRLKILGTTPRFRDLDRARVQARHFVDDCRTIRVNVMLADGEDRARTLVIASPQGRDGKTTVAINLATSIALTGKRVLLVDGDLRKPEVARYLRMNNAKGLTNVLGGECSLEEALQPTIVPTLHILPSNRNGHKQSDLLVSRRLSAILAELRQRFDEIVVDTPAILAMPDAKLWACLSDGVVLIARSGKTGMKELIEAKNRIQQAGATILGVVITGAKISDSYEKYSSRYGEGYVDEPLSKEDWDATKVFLLSRHTEQDREPESPEDS